MKIDLSSLAGLMERARKIVADFDVRERAGVISTVILAWLGLNLGFAFLINVPRANEVASLREQVRHLNREISRKTLDVDRLRPQQKRVVEGNSNLEVFYDEVLSTKRKRLISFQKELREIAGKFRINMDAVNYPREQLANKVTKLSAAMPLSGSYENLRSFLETIEGSRNFIVIDSIQLANSKEGGVVLSLTILLSTYFVDPDAPDRPIQQAQRG
ncbi:MAG: type 4a pilus biogenesis protein PilO [Acidobacteriota bacterium]